MSTPSRTRPARGPARRRPLAVAAAGLPAPPPRRAGVMLGTALTGVGLTIAIPLVTKALIDGPITDGELGAVLPLGPARPGPRRARGGADLVAPLGAVQRRARRRDRDAPRPLRAPPAAADELPHQVAVGPAALARHHRPQRHPPLLRLRPAVPGRQHRCRSSSSRVVLLTMYWPLGLVVAATAVPIVWLSMRFEKAYVVVSRRVQDQQGDLATLAEEGAVGIRVIKSFGRSEHVSGQFEAAARQLRATSMDKVRLSAQVLDLPQGDPQPRRRGRAAARRDRRRPRRS